MATSRSQLRPSSVSQIPPNCETRRGAIRHDKRWTANRVQRMEPGTVRSNLSAFVAWRQDHLTGDEKGEAAIYLERLFQAFGHGGIREAGATLEARIHRFDLGGVSYADLLWKPRCLIEMKKAGTDLARHFRQAFQYWMDAVPDRPRYVVLCNFDELWIYDFDKQLGRVSDVERRSGLMLGS